MRRYIPYTRTAFLGGLFRVASGPKVFLHLFGVQLGRVLDEDAIELSVCNIGAIVLFAGLVLNEDAFRELLNSAADEIGSLFEAPVVVVFR